MTPFTQEPEKPGKTTTFSTINTLGQRWQILWCQVASDWKAIKWKSVGFWFLVFCWVGGLISGLSFLQLLPRFSDTGSSCAPDDVFRVVNSNFNYWSRSGFFSITIGSGPLSFTAAKAIDIVWDVAVGRGGQALIALISWRTFKKYVTTSMEVTPVTFGTYRTIFIRSEASVFSLSRLIRDFISRRGLHSRCAMVFMVATMIFVLAFPTMASAMTGYSSPVQSFVLVQDNATNGTQNNNNLMPFSAFAQVLYVIHDGDRIVNRTKDLVVTKDNRFKEDPMMYLPSPLSSVNYDWLRTDDDWNFKSNVSDYVKQHGFYGRNNVSSTFMNQSLTPPTLNISAYYLENYKDTIYGYNWTDPQTNTQPFNNISNAAWTTGGQIYSKSYILENGSCQAMKNYQWGFSYIQLFVMVVLLFIWTVGIYLLWLKAHLTMRERGPIDVAGENKAVLELADALRDQVLFTDDLNKHELTERELRDRITRGASHGRMTYQVPMLKEPISLCRGLWRWLCRDRWWILAVVLCMVCIGLLWALSLSGWIWAWVQWLWLVFGMSIGKTTGSRLFFTLCFSVFWAMITGLLAVFVFGASYGL